MRIIVTAGPTREPIDIVRFISNRSTGKMGYAIAETGAIRGHDIILISGHVNISVPEGVRLIKITTAKEMHKAVHNNIDWCDVLIMAAAVADWRPVRSSLKKISKREMSGEMLLERTDDILLSLRDKKEARIYIGFAAESDNILNKARLKLKSKDLDLIVANDITETDSGFESDTNKVLFITQDNIVQNLPVMKKRAVAEKIFDWIEAQNA